MIIQKNVASQKVVFLMVDATDFATPEPSMTVSAYYSKDGAARSTCSNSVSEITSGLYVLTLAATETNAGVCAYQFTASGAADQYLVVYPEDGYANKISSILADTITLSNATYGLDALETIVSDVLSTLDDNVANKLTSILADTVTLSNATYGLDALETIASDILEAIDSIAAGPLASILVDTNATLDDKLDSILADTKEINSQCDSILADTITLSNATYGLDALETIVSDTLAAVGDITVWTESERKQIRSALGVSGDVSALAAYGTNSRLDNATYGLNALETITSDILEAIDSAVAGPIASILVDTNATLDNKIDSILADTITLSNATYGLNALETITSQTKSTLDNATFGLDALESLGSQILVDTATISNLGAGSDSAILSTLDGPVGNKLTSILADTNTISNLGAGSDSAILSTLDGPVGNALTSILADTNTISNLGAGDDSHILSTLDQYLPSILTDTGTTLDNKIDSILVDTNTISNLGAGSDSAILSTLDHIVSTVDNATIGLDALETITSDILEAVDSVVAGPLASILVDTNATLDNKIDSILADTKTTLPSTLSNILSTIDHTISALDSTVAGPLASILVDTNTTLDNKIDSILADTITLSNATYGLDALETITSQIKSTIDAPITNFLTSIVDDTSKIHSTIDGPIESALTQNTALNSDILSTIDGAGLKPATTEPAAGAPSATAPSGVKLDYLFTVFRNKIETTSGVQKIYDDAGTTVLFSCALSDDATTFTKGEHA